MSYNIDTWKTKKINGLTIPMVAIKKLPYVIIDRDDDNVSVEGTAEGFCMSGRLVGKQLHVDNIEYYGEGSGHEWDALKAMLARSTGELVATQVWEEGDSITRLTFVDGVVSEENIEI